jgi:asparagine synthase (glutamine-hydrolysing)
MRAEFGTDCHLTGDGGDSLLCSPPIMLADLITAGRYRRALVDTISWARLRRVAVWPLLAQAWQTTRTTRREALRTLARTWRTGAEHHPVADIRTGSGVGWIPDITVPPWSTTQARERAGSLADIAADRSRPTLSADACTQVTGEMMARVGRTARADVELAASYDVPLHNPFVDSRLIDTYLSLPLGARPGPAEYKPVLREALADLFPVSLAARRTKGSFTADFYQGMRANLAALLGLADGRLAELGLVNPSALRYTLTAVSAGLPLPFSAVEPAIAAEVWLRALDTVPAIEWAERAPSPTALQTT